MNDLWILKYHLRPNGEWKIATCSDVCPGGVKSPFIFQTQVAAHTFGENLQKNSDDKIDRILAETLKARIGEVVGKEVKKAQSPEEYNKEVEAGARGMQIWLSGLKNMAPSAASGYWIMFNALKNKGFSSEEALDLTAESLRFLAGR